MENQSNRNKSLESFWKGNKRLFFGVVLIVIGTAWIFEQTGLMPRMLKEVIFSWQMLLIAFGIFSLNNENKLTGWIFISLGTIFLLPEVIEIPRVLTRLRWPILLIILGLIILVRRRSEPREIIGRSGEGIDFFDDFVVFGGREVIVNSQQLVGGRSTTMFGGSEYDLRVSKLSEEGAVIDCVSLFGGTSFKVPPDWLVKNEVSTILGAFSDKRGNVIADTTNPSKCLVIRGFTAFGGIEVKNF